MAERGEPSGDSQALESQNSKKGFSLQATSFPFASSHRGNWNDMPLDFLEVVANVCYQFPKPRFIDPAVVYDTVKIRRLVEEAAGIAHLATCDIDSLKLASINGDFLDTWVHDGSEFARRQNSRLSSERRFHMKDQAIQRLARALRLNEATCSILIAVYLPQLKSLTQSAMARTPHDPDVNYVHLFLQKAMHPTAGPDIALQTLGEIIAGNPGQPQIWRTKGIIHMMKKDFTAAYHDFTCALSLFRYDACGNSVVMISNTPKEQPQSTVKLADHEQPSSLLGQLQFLRGWAHLCAACEQVNVSMGRKGELDKENSMAGVCSDEESQQSNAEEHEPLAAKRVKILAKRSLSDIMGFLSGLDYSPDLAIATVREFSERTERCDYGFKRTRHTERNIASQPCTKFKVSQLFSAKPPSGLPPFPVPKVKTELDGVPGPDSPIETHCEIVTAHPMLSEALHQLLLCHCLLQTSTTELTRHAHMVARLTKLIDGTPVFGTNEAPSRADWTELTLRVHNWIDLPDEWDALCRPEPLVACAQSPEMTILKNRIKALLAQRVTSNSGTQEAQKPEPADQTYGSSRSSNSTDGGRSEEVKSRALTDRARSIMYWINNAPKLGATRPRKRKLKGNLNTAEHGGDV